MKQIQHSIRFDDALFFHCIVIYLFRMRIDD